MTQIRTTTEKRRSKIRPGETYDVSVKEVRCCGSWLGVSGRFTTTCDDCGADYNSVGQRLAARECWGEETGESWQDCY